MIVKFLSVNRKFVFQCKDNTQNFTDDLTYLHPIGATWLNKMSPLQGSFPSQLTLLQKYRSDGAVLVATKVFPSLCFLFFVYRFHFNNRFSTDAAPSGRHFCSRRQKNE